MSINKSQNRISTPDLDTSKNTPVNIIPKTEILKAQTEIDLSDLHEAAQYQEENTTPLATKEKLFNQEIDQKIDPNKLNFFEKFLHDNWGIRKFFALGNEIAESCYELAEHLLPKPIAKALYGAFWSLAVVATGSRVTMNAKMAKQEDRLKAGAKMLMHDGISAIAAPTAVAKTATFIQNKLYAPLPIPKTIKHLVKSAVSLYACYFTIHKLDPHAMELSGKLLKHRNDSHKVINEALGNGHEKKGH
jgi:hypothetical protein